MTGLRPLRWAAKLGILFCAWIEGITLFLFKHGDQGSSGKSVTVDCRLLEVFAPSFNKKDFDLGMKAKTVNVMTYWGKFIIEAMQACSILLAVEGLNRSRNRSVPPVLDVKGIKRMLQWCYTYHCRLAVFPASVESFYAVIQGSKLDNFLAALLTLFSHRFDVKSYDAFHLSSSSLGSSNGH